ncbi:AAA family ATPase [Plasticicumulans acidivorans]|uniref:AAA family ATPase n=1 Tax=Plasticicumulans acidivorans TaxID=886464 RepID=UPI000D71180F|nr:ATP-binding protein [Plasticicumulans acidivorans]
MKLQIERPYVEALVDAFPHLSSLHEQLRFGTKAEVAFEQLSARELGFLHDLYVAAGPRLAGQVAQLATLLHALDVDGERFEDEDELENVVPALARFLNADAIRGWLFRANVAGRALAYVVARLDYTPPGNEESARVLIELKANAKAKLAQATIMITGRDIAGKTIGEILAAKGWLKETPALIAAYDETAERYFDWRARYGEQFSASGIGFYAEDPTATHRSTDWSRKDVVILSASGGQARVVNDEGIIGERVVSGDLTGDIFSRYLRKAAKSARYDSGVERAVEAAQADVGRGLFTELPVHGYIFVFHLDLHHYLWVHVDDMTPYAYQPALKQKLVLPPEQTDLIDILTAEMDVLMDDVIAGKSGGTTVLCAGPAGVGKTLTAEVYAEIVRRPLYRVHSGQLGLNVAAMETALKDVLTRAQRWGAVMLIDEADVYIKRRDDNMTMNAVVGVFLRVLEYFNGLLFLTTNRIDDIDDAIVSRCIALIRYDPPDTAARCRIWEVMSEQFELGLAPALISELAERFPHATGRDIKGLAKLTAKFCHQKQQPPSIDAFVKCSIFRGMERPAQTAEA